MQSDYIQTLMIVLLVGLNVFFRYKRISDRSKHLGEIVDSIKVSMLQRLTSQLLTVALIAILAYLFSLVETPTVFDYVFYGSIMLLFAFDIYRGFMSNLEFRTKGICYQHHEFTYEQLKSIELGVNTLDCLSATGKRRRFFVKNAKDLSLELPNYIKVKRS